MKTVAQVAALAAAVALFAGCGGEEPSAPQQEPQGLEWQARDEAADEAAEFTPPVVELPRERQPSPESQVAEEPVRDPLPEPPAEPHPLRPASPDPWEAAADEETDESPSVPQALGSAVWRILDRNVRPQVPLP